MSILEDKLGRVPAELQTHLDNLHRMEVAVEECDCESGMPEDAYAVLTSIAPTYDMVLPPKPELDGLGRKEVALESIRSTLVQWWETFKKWLLEMRQKIVTWIRDTLQGLNGLIKNAKSMRELVSAKTDWDTSPVTIKSPNLLAIDGKQVSDIPRALVELRKIADVSLDKFIIQGQKAAKELTADLQKLDNKVASHAVESYVNSFSLICTDRVKNSVAEEVFGIDPREVEEERTSKVLLGNYRFVSVKAKRETHYTNNEEENLSAIANYGKQSRIRFFQDGTKDVLEGELKAVSQKEALLIIDESIRLAESVKASNAQRDSESKLEKEFMRKADEAAKLYLSEDTDGDKQRAVRTLFSVVISMINGLGFGFEQYLVNVCKSSLAYVDAIQHESSAEG